jgi:hypothetical protein
VTRKFFELLPNIAVISTGVLVFTVDVVTLKVVLDKPVVMVTDGGTVAAPALLVRLTVVLLEVAPLRPTVHVDNAGGVTLVGLHVKVESTGVTG